MTFILSLLLVSQIEISAEPQHFYNRIQPCERWTYDFDLRAYVCSSHHFGLDVVERFEFDQLQRRVTDLERRVEALERDRDESKSTP